MIDISVIIPVYKAEKCLQELYNRLKFSLEQITHNFEIILVEDCGRDNSWEIIKELSVIDYRIKGFQFSRNFGQHYAISAGLDYCSGEWVVVMDCDLQDQPEEILKLYKEAQKGYDIVFARRIKRKDKFLRKFFSKVFYKTLGFMTNTVQDATIANFGIYNKKVIDALKNFKENFRYFPVFIRWLGFNYSSIEVDHASRKEGKSSYNYQKMFNLALDVIIAFSDKPLRIFVLFGFIISFISFIFASKILFKIFLGYKFIVGWSSLITSIWLLSGIIIMILGVIGMYIGKIFEEVKKRPVYVIKDFVNINKKVFT